MTTGSPLVAAECVDCKTTGGKAAPGGKRPRRRLGRCDTCYSIYLGTKKRAEVDPTVTVPASAASRFPPWNPSPQFIAEMEARKDAIRAEKIEKLRRRG